MNNHLELSDSLQFHQIVCCLVLVCFCLQVTNLIITIITLVIETGYNFNILSGHACWEPATGLLSLDKDCQLQVKSFSFSPTALLLLLRATLCAYRDQREHDFQASLGTAIWCTMLNQCIQTLSYKLCVSGPQNCIRVANGHRIYPLHRFTLLHSRWGAFKAYNNHIFDFNAIIFFEKAPGSTEAVCYSILLRCRWKEFVPPCISLSLWFMFCFYQESFLPSCDHVRVVRMLVKHLHYFVNSAPRPDIQHSPYSATHDSCWDDLKR